MIWGYAFADVERHLAALGFERILSDGENGLYMRGLAPFTIRCPNALGSLPQALVDDAFDRAGLPPPPPATGYVD